MHVVSIKKVYTGAYVNVSVFKRLIKGHSLFDCMYFYVCSPISPSIVDRVWKFFVV